MNQRAIDTFRKILAPISRRINLMIARAALNLIDDTKGYQRLQVSIGEEVLPSVERLQNYGFTSSPQKKSEAVLVFVGGDRGHPLAIVVDDGRYRKKNLEPGEVAMYTDEGAYLHFQRSKKAVLRSDKFSVQSESDELVKVLSDLAAWLIASRTATMAGPEPLFNPDGSLLSDIKDRIDAFKI